MGDRKSIAVILLDNLVLELIAQSPKGITIRELSERLGVKYYVARRIIRRIHEAGLTTSADDAPVPCPTCGCSPQGRPSVRYRLAV